MAFGFVVVKFAIFIKQISIALGKQTDIHQKGYSSTIGIMLVAAGAATTLFSYLCYQQAKKKLENNT